MQKILKNLLSLFVFLWSGVCVAQVTSNGWIVGGTDNTVIGNVSDAEKASCIQNTSPWVDNITQFGGTNVVTGAGASGSGIPRVTVADDSFPTSAPANVAPIDGQKATYAASIVGLVTASTPTDIFTLTGSGTKTVRILGVLITGTQGTAALRDILFIIRSSANTGGTSTNPARVPYDSNSAAATATVNAYTANPSALGATVGTINAFKFALSAINNNTAVGTDTTPFAYGNRPGQAIVLRGTSQVFAVNLNSVTSATSSFDISIEWSEE